MSNIAKKITKIFLVIFLAAFLSSCDGGCVSADEFSGSFVTVNSDPGDDKITGTYPADSASCASSGSDCEPDGGQKIEWIDTGFKSSGEYFLIQITGEWLPWYGDTTNSDLINGLKRCSFCTKKTGFVSSTDNCICHKNQISEPEISGDNHNPVPNVDCSSGGPDETDPDSCTCTTQNGLATAYTNFHIPLNYEDKFGIRKEANDQDICKYDGGMGLYIGLFGSSGNDVPKRIYHLFTEDRVCDVDLDNNGECLDDTGADVSKYVYRSPNNAIFVKDDKNGNNTDDDHFGDLNTEMHSANEVVKLIIYDSYYMDNNGSYNVTFYNGVGGSGVDGRGLLEFVVATVEDAVLGDIDPATCTVNLTTGTKRCERTGGIIEFMYKSLVTDSGFAMAVQVLLSLYIAFYGMATLMGVAEINKKELMSRLLKIALIVAFISPNSWQFYNEIVVNFFKNSMDSMVALVMDASDSNLYSANPQNTSSLILAQMDRAVDASNATRFSYIDTTIDKLLSVAVAKKIFGLFFGTFFGLLYIPIIYFLIAFFIYVMLMAASFYLVNMMKIIFALALGPLFMCFSLFGQTNEIFKKWISFLGARSLEILFLFLILYNFILIIDTKFTALLSYSVCVESWGLAGAKIKILEADVNRSLSAWVSGFIGIGALIFITKMIVDKIPSVAGYLISIGGQSNKDAGGVGRGASGMNMVGSMMGKSGLLGATMAGLRLGASAAYNGAGVGVQAGTIAYRAAKSGVARTGVGQAIYNSPVGKAAGVLNRVNPYRLRDAYRNSLIDDQIKKFQAEAKSKGKTGQDADMHVRQGVYASLQKKMHREWGNNSGGSTKTYDPTGMKFADINMTSIGRRLDQKLVDEPLKKHIKDNANAIKNSANPLLGNALRDKLAQDAKAYANANLIVDAKSLDKKLSKDMKGLLKEQSSYSPDQAAKSFRGRENEYLDHLRNVEFDRSKKLEASKKNGVSGAAYRAGKYASKIVSHSDRNNTKKAGQRFLDKVEKANRVEQREKEINSRSGLRYIWASITSPGHQFDKATGSFVKSDIKSYIPYATSRTVKDNARSASAESLRRSLNTNNDLAKKERQSAEERHVNKAMETQNERQSLQKSRKERPEQHDKKIAGISKKKEEMMQEYSKKISDYEKKSGIMKVGSKTVTLGSKSLKLKQEQKDKAKEFDKQLREARANKDKDLREIDRKLALVPTQNELDRKRDEDLKRVDERLKNSKNEDKREFFKEQLKKMTRKDAQEELSAAAKESALREKMLEEAQRDVKKIEKQQEVEAKEQKDALKEQQKAVREYEQAQKEALKGLKKGEAGKKQEADLKKKEEAAEEYKRAKKEFEAQEEYRTEGVYKVLINNKIMENGEEKDLEREMTLLEAQERVKYLQEAINKINEQEERDGTNAQEVPDSDAQNPLNQHIDERYESDLLGEDLEEENLGEDDVVNPMGVQLELDREKEKLQESSDQEIKSLEQEINDRKDAANQAKEDQDALDQENAEIEKQKEKLDQETLAAQQELEALNKKEVEGGSIDIIFDQVDAQERLSKAQASVVALDKKVAANNKKKVQIKAVQDSEEKIVESKQEIAKLEKDMIEVRQSLISDVNNKEMETRQKEIEQSIASQKQQIELAESVKADTMLNYDLDRSKESLEKNQAQKDKIDARISYLNNSIDVSQQYLKASDDQTKGIENDLEALNSNIDISQEALEEANARKNEIEHDLELSSKAQEEREKASQIADEIQKGFQEYNESLTNLEQGYQDPNREKPIAELENDVNEKHASFLALSQKQELEEQIDIAQRDLKSSQDERKALEADMQSVVNAQLIAKKELANNAQLKADQDKLKAKQQESKKAEAKKLALAKQIADVKAKEVEQEKAYELNKDKRNALEERIDTVEKFIEQSQEKSRTSDDVLSPLAKQQEIEGQEQRTQKLLDAVIKSREAIEIATNRKTEIAKDREKLSLDSNESSQALAESKTRVSEIDREKTTLNSDKDKSEESLKESQAMSRRIENDIASQSKALEEQQQALQKVEEMQKTAQEFKEIANGINEAQKEISKIRSMELLSGTIKDNADIKGSISKDEEDKIREITDLQSQVGEKRETFVRAAKKQDREEKVDMSQKALESSQKTRQDLEQELAAASDSQINLESEINTNEALKADAQQLKAKQDEVATLEARKQELAQKLVVAQEAEELKEKSYKIQEARAQYENAIDDFEQFIDHTDLERDSEEYNIEKERLYDQAQAAATASKTAEMSLSVSQLKSSVEQRSEIEDANLALDSGDIDAAKDIAKQVEDTLDGIDDSLESNKEDPVLGSDNRKSSKDFAKNSYGIQRAQKLSRSKLAQLSLKVSQAELDKLQSKNAEDLTAADNARMSVLQQEISKYENDYKKFEQEASDIDSKMQDLDQQD